MTLHQIVKKLTGEVTPLGEHYEDVERFENLRKTLELVDRLLLDITVVSLCKDSPDAGKSKAGKRAYEFLNEVKED